MRDVLKAIRATAARTPERIAITDQFGAMSYGALDQAIASACAALSLSPRVIGLLMPRDHSHIVTDLALAALGRTIVPLPDFFSVGQWRHMVIDAGIEAVVTTAAGRARLAELDVPTLVPPPDAVADAWPDLSPSRRIIYTSGTTGAPKGVVLEENAMTASLSGLEMAAEASPEDVHLSVLPFSLLLEQLAGLLLPLKLGARIHIVASPQQAPQEAEQQDATTSVLVPELLAAWVQWLRHSGRRAPQSLRFVAVGGAPVGEELAQSAWEMGLPVHEGYGLSECCSVVAVNRPGQRRPGTVGQPLAGVNVSIDDGEIIVHGPTVMAGYLGGVAANGLWRTGDCGQIQSDGTLVVLGRKDDVIVTANGRNVHPEWIEPMIRADAAIRTCALIAGDGGIKAVLIPAPPIDASSTDWLARLQALTQTAPAYARPTEVAILSAAQAQANALFTPDGRPRRRRIAQFLKEAEMSLYETLVADTTRDRQSFLAIPLISQAVSEGVDASLYLAFLNSAYHHVRYTVPLLETALAACGPDDAALAEGLRDYIAEEIGHDEWILNDINALGGDVEVCRRARPPLAVRVLVATAFHLIAEEGPYSLLGMVHVLEGMSVALAIKAADCIRARVGGDDSAGFTYLTSHGGLDVGHVEGFARLLDVIDSPERRRTIIAATKDFYALYADVFRSLALRPTEVSHAA
ncbi:AMP-binding protein [Magnetospirillum sulfuroxidans]|uniref:AMP-binding protein n=1 Tax=Magnetospirillum sulfuroxidans TaxID=611300 RepID=A0ABS5IA41_9PROT|nr:AMP-binding protein [Magnetospirillum sulfuroxidans]MBR9970563.1 AMP-binding protein [Magnetospirillum sulfuroxidans]